MAESNGKPPTRAAKFGTKHTLILPQSLETVEVRRPSTYTLVAAGHLPAELSTLVWKLYGREMDIQAATNEAKSLKEYAALVDALLPQILRGITIIDPKAEPDAVTDVNVGEDGIARGRLRLVDMLDLDKNTIFLYGVGVLASEEEMAERKTQGVVAPDLSTFRDEREGAAAGGGGAPLQPATVGDGGAGPEEPAGA